MGDCQTSNSFSKIFTTNVVKLFTTMINNQNTYKKK